MTKRARAWIVTLSMLLGMGTIGLADESPATSQDKESHGTHGHWSYEGETGPEHWSELDPEFTACAKGKYEAPIDIDAAEQSDLPPLQFRYAVSPLTIVDNGHTIMAPYAPGSTLTIGDARYELQQFHFHRPSEELVHGRASAMEVHLVHKDARGHLAVVAVLLDQGKASPVIEKLWEHLPTVKEKPATFTSVSIDAKGLLPASHGYYTFAGSLTTPPCTEGVTWYVLKTPVEVSSEQIAAFAKLYPMNVRPVQPLNGRKILETRN
jgi:carbonic anhydrase